MPGCAASLLALGTFGSLGQCAGHAVIRPGSPPFLGVEVPTRWVLAFSRGGERRPAEALPAAAANEPEDPVWAAARRRRRCFYVTAIFLLALICAVCCCYCCLDKGGVLACLGLILLGFVAATEGNFASGLHKDFVEAAGEGRSLPLRNAWCWLPMSLTAFWSAWYILGILMLGGVLMMSFIALGIYSYRELTGQDPSRAWASIRGDGHGAQPLPGAGASKEVMGTASLAEEEEGEESEDAGTSGRCREAAVAAVECPVCLNRYTVVSRRPQVLGCGHTFCSACVVQLTRGNRLTCPTCREELSAKEVRVNYALRDAMAENSLVQGPAGRSGIEKAEHARSSP